MSFAAADYTTGAGTNTLAVAPELGQLNYLEYDDANQKHVKVQLYDGKLYFQVRDDTSGNYNTPRSIQDKDIMLIRDMYGCFGNPRNLCLKFALNFPGAVIGDFTPSAKQALYRVFSQCVNPRTDKIKPFPLEFPSSGKGDAGVTAVGPFSEEALVTEMIIDTSYPQNMNFPLSLGSAVEGATGPETSGGVTVQVLQGVTVIFTVSYNGNGSIVNGNTETLLKKYLAGYVSTTGAVNNSLYWSLTTSSNDAKDNLSYLFAGVNNLNFKGTYSYTTSAATALEITGLLPSLINLLTHPDSIATSANLSSIISDTDVKIPSNAVMANSVYNPSLLSTIFTQLLNYTPKLPSAGPLNGATIANISQYLSADPRAQVIHKNVPAGILSVKTGILKDGNFDEYVVFNVNLVGNWDHWGVKLNPLSFTNPSDINDNSYVRIRNGKYTTFVTSAADATASSNDLILKKSDITVNTPFWITVFDKNYNPLYAYFNILSVTAANPAATPPALATATVNPELAYRFSIANNYY